MQYGTLKTWASTSVIFSRKRGRAKTKKMLFPNLEVGGEFKVYTRGHLLSTSYNCSDMNPVLDALQDIPVQVQFYDSKDDDKYVILSQNLWGTLQSIFDDAELTTDPRSGLFVSISLARRPSTLSWTELSEGYPLLESVLTKARMEDVRTSYLCFWWPL